MTIDAAADLRFDWVQSHGSMFDLQSAKSASTSTERTTYGHSILVNDHQLGQRLHESLALFFSKPCGLV
jgi:hypothetical protein